MSRILVFLALQEEHDQFSEYFTQSSTDIHNGTIICSHAIDVDGFELYSVLADGMGPDNAYDAVTNAVKYCSPKIVVCLGIAGSLSDDLQVGDVCVSNEIIDVSQNWKIIDIPQAQRRHSKSRPKQIPVQARGQKVQLSPKFIPVDSSLSATFRFLRTHPTLKVDLATWRAQCTEELKNLFENEKQGNIARPERDVSEDTGPIISGPLVASDSFKATLRDIDRKVKAVDMESAGVARASQAANIPYVTIRGISDLADPNKSTLERTTKAGARAVAVNNAIRYFALQLKNPSFMRIAQNFEQDPGQSELFQSNSEPDALLHRISQDLNDYLEAMSPEYKLRPNKAPIPTPRIQQGLVEDEAEIINSRGPISVAESLISDDAIFIRIPKSFPNQTLAWAIGQSLLVHEFDGKQALPVVLAGDEFYPPQKGILHASRIEPNNATTLNHFSPVLIVSEPPFGSEPRLDFLVREIKTWDGVRLVVLSRAELPTDAIDDFKQELGLTEYMLTPAPFSEVATYLEAAFEMSPDQADSVANRLTDTFSRFRLHTHPAYFVGLQEATIDALIQANQRAELIQLAVDGLLSFVVALDSSTVKLNRTTREEFLVSLAFDIKVQGLTFTKADLLRIANEFGDHKALEIDAENFVRGFYSVGLINDIGGKVSFSVPYLEAYLLAERLKNDPSAAAQYFDPENPAFDHFTFDLYVERGPCTEVVSRICEYAREALERFDSDEDVFTGRRVSPRALSNRHMLLHLVEQMGKAAEKISESGRDENVRAQKQRLLDTRETVKGRVATRSKSRDNLPKEVQQRYADLDRLSRASTLLATIIGSGAERLDGDTKRTIADLVLTVVERFMHFWTLDRLGINFDEIRTELEDDEFISSILERLGLYEEDTASVREDLMSFLDDQEMRLLSEPARVMLDRLAQYAGVRSLKPVLVSAGGKNAMERLLRDVWLMDVEHSEGKRHLKDSLSKYKGSWILRLVITSHLMQRVFWHHWKRDSRQAFIKMARYAIAPLKLVPTDDHTQRMLRGPRG